MKAALLYYHFLDDAGRERMIGGVETYLWNLTKLIAERGDEPILFQPAAAPFTRQIEHVKVIGVEPNRRRLRANTRRDLYERAEPLLRAEKALVIFGADHAGVHTDYPRSLSIQHGVGWDLPARFLRPRLVSRIPLVPDWLVKRYAGYRAAWSFRCTMNRVCVDHNFPNWYRTHITDVPDGRTWVIPNFVDAPAGYQPDLGRHRQDSVRILFARRFVEMRGTRLMIHALQRLLPLFPKVEACFAGEGPDHHLIASAFEKEPRVSFRKYLPDEALKVHEAFHLAVVPSLASEGTSLSLAEAMAAGCAVVATNVGGMTNMVIDGYNGRLVDPNPESLFEALAELVRNAELRERLGMRASQTAQEAFSLVRWKARWSQVLDHVQSIPV